MASLGPLGRAYTVRCGAGFLDHAVALIGSVVAWDDIQEMFDLYLSRIPERGHRVVGELYGLTLMTQPPLTVFYNIIYDDHVVELLEVELV